MKRFTVRFRNTFYLALLFTCHYAAAQIKESSTNHSLNNIIPPSPNASALAKFGDIPVGYATGIPKVNVPIYEYKNPNGELSLSISLDYHAGGIRVDDVASDVGIGWAINAGGVISRTLRGIPDEVQGFGFIDAALLPVTETDGNNSNVYSQIDGGVRDGQNDIFNFNFGNKAGKFMFGKRNDFLMLTSQKVHVEKIMGDVPGKLTNPSIKQFILTDENGTKYVFDALEETLTLGMVWPGSKDFISSWYLTKIIAPFETDIIEIKYEDIWYEYTTGVSTSKTIGTNTVGATFPSRQQSSTTSSASLRKAGSNDRFS